MSEKSGTRLADAGVKLYAVFGATETGAVTKIFNVDDSEGPDAPWKTSNDWQWMEFADNVNIRWVPQGDGTFEMQFLVRMLLKKLEPSSLEYVLNHMAQTCDGHQPAIENIPDVRGYATSDLFEPHPTKKNLWRM